MEAVRLRRVFYAAVGGLAVVIVLSGPPLELWTVRESCKTPNFNSVLNQLWCWLNFNKDSIGPLIQILGLLGLAVAAVSFMRTQHLNQANAVFQMMKEARDLRLKLDAPAPNAVPAPTKLWMGMNFYASIFQYRHLEFVDAETWKPFEDDLEAHMRNEDFVNWLNGGENVMRLPDVHKFDPRFIEYLKSIQRRVQGTPRTR